MEATDVINLIDGIGSDKESAASDEVVTDEDGNVISDGETETVWILTKKTTPTGSSEEYLYDDAYNLVKVVSCYDDGEEFSRIDISYDSEGNRINDSMYINGEKWGFTEYTYDAKGNLLEDIEYLVDYELDRREYTYDSDGNMLSEIRYEYGEEKYHYEYTWTSVELPSAQAERVRKQMKDLL